MTYYMTATVEMDATDFTDRSEGGYAYVKDKIESFDMAFCAEIDDYYIEETKYEGVYRVKVEIRSNEDTAKDFEVWKGCERVFLPWFGENWSDVEVWEDP